VLRIIEDDFSLCVAMGNGKKELSKYRMTASRKARHSRTHSPTTPTHSLTHVQQQSLMPTASGQKWAVVRGGCGSGRGRIRERNLKLEPESLADNVRCLISAPVGCF